MAKRYEPTYEGYIQRAIDSGTDEEYRWAAAIIRKSRNLTRQGRANALRDLRDGFSKTGIPEITYWDWVTFRIGAERIY